MKTQSIKKVLLATLCWGLLITGCSDSEETTSGKPSFKLENLTQTAWLNQSLPESTIAYLRLPNPWSGFSKKDDSFKYALGNEQHVQALRNIQQGVYDNIVAKLQDHVKPLVEFYIEHTTAPIEVAFVSQNSGQPVIFAATKLDYADADAFNQALKALTQGMPNARLMPEEGETKGFVSFGPTSAYYQYDTDNKQFLLISGMGVSVNSLEAAAESIKGNDKHSMLALENTVDSSHQGLFVWASPKKAMSLMQMGLPPEKLNELKKLGIDQANGVAMGYGVSEGKTRLKLLVDMPDVGVRQFIPRFNHDIDLKTVGTPKSAAIIAWPTSEQVNTIIENAEEFEPGLKEGWSELSVLITKEFGVSFEDILDVMKSSILRVNDDAGVYWAWKHDSQKWSKVLKAYQEKLGGEYSKAEKSGVTIHHLTMPMLDEDILESLPTDQNPLFSALSGMKQHIYWTVEDDYMIYSAVPQVLIERAKRGPDTDLGQWLGSTQGIDYSDVLLGYTTSVEDLSRDSYHYYLEALNQLGDISGADIDLMSLPTAGELGFPDKGAVGITLNSGEKYFGLELSFENGASDLLVGGGGTSAVAVVGILAAVAIPAYQDYTVRAEMASGSYSAEMIKLQIAESLAAGATVDDLDNGFEGIEQSHDYETSILEKIVVVDGVITVFYKNNKLGYGPKTIVYVPMFNEGQVTYWDCTGGTVARKYRPASCK